MIVDPVTIAPELSVRQALEFMNKYRVSGLPVTRGQRSLAFSRIAICASKAISISPSAP